jgi:hypothetical protein
MTASDPNKVSADIREYVRQLVAGGFDSSAAIFEAVMEVYRDGLEPMALRATAEQFTKEAVKQHQANQMSWPDVTDCDHLDAALTELNRLGIVCRQNFSCCGTCGAGEILDEMEAERQVGTDVRGYAFYHAQDTETAVDGHGLYLSYGASEETEEAALLIGDEICEALRSHGLTVNWGRCWDRRIHVVLDWKRRRRTEGV